MPWSLDELLHQNSSVTKTLERFTLCRLQCVQERRWVVNRAHTLTTTTMNGLDKDGKTFEHGKMRVIGVKTRHDMYLFSEPQRGGAVGLDLYHGTQVCKTHQHLQRKESMVRVLVISYLSGGA